MHNSIRTIRLYGVLGSKFGRVHRLAVNSAAEAVRALSMQLRGFDEFLTNAKDRGIGFSVFYGKRNLDENSLRSLADADIRIAPILMGSKNGGWLNIIVGAVIVVASVVIDAFTDGAFGAATGYSSYAAGIAMIAGGLVQLLTPVAKGRSSQDTPEEQASYNFNGPINTQAQGNPVPVVYGDMIVGSAVLSAGISSADQAFS